MGVGYLYFKKYFQQSITLYTHILIYKKKVLICTLFKNSKTKLLPKLFKLINFISLEY